MHKRWWIISFAVCSLYLIELSHQRNRGINTVYSLCVFMRIEIKRIIQIGFQSTSNAKCKFSDELLSDYDDGVMYKVVVWLKHVM